MKIAAAAVTAAAVVLGLWLFLPGAVPRPLPAPARALTIHASFAPAAAGFGDTVTARIEVIVDRSVVRPETVRTVYALAPLTLLATPVEHRVTQGDTTIVSTVVKAACLTDPCVAGRGRTVPSVAPVRADATRRDGGRVSESAAWTRLEIDSRVGAADLAAARPPFRVEVAPPTPTYRIAPRTFALLLDLTAVLLVGAGLALVAAALGRREKAGATPDALRRALALARAARARPVPDRRSALGLVARLIASRDRRLARSADDLAWSRPAPTPERLTDLLDDVERELRT
jgi:hypothetical protein